MSNVRYMFHDTTSATLYITCSTDGLITQRPSVFRTHHTRLDRDIYYGLGKRSNGSIITSSGVSLSLDGSLDTTMYMLWSSALEYGNNGKAYRTYADKLIAIDQVDQTRVALTFSGALLTLDADAKRNLLWVGTDSAGEDPYMLFICLPMK